MKKVLCWVFGLGLGVFAASLLIYWFNLENKLIYYVIRPLLQKCYAAQKRDVRI